MVRMFLAAVCCLCLSPRAIADESNPATAPSLDKLDASALRELVNTLREQNESLRRRLDTLEAENQELRSRLGATKPSAPPIKQVVNSLSAGVVERDVITDAKTGQALGVRLKIKMNHREPKHVSKIVGPISLYDQTTSPPRLLYKAEPTTFEMHTQLGRRIGRTGKREVRRSTWGVQTVEVRFTANDQAAAKLGQIDVGRIGVKPGTMRIVYADRSERTYHPVR